MRRFSVLIEQDEDGVFVATVPELPGCHTQADSQEELLERVREAIQLYLETKGAPDTRSTFVGVTTVEV